MATNEEKEAAAAEKAAARDREAAEQAFQNAETERLEAEGEAARLIEESNAAQMRAQTAVDAARVAQGGMGPIDPTTGEPLATPEEVEESRPGVVSGNFRGIPNGPNS